MKTMILAAFLMFQAVTCPVHNSVCHGTAQYQYIGGHAYERYDCACGDQLWVRTN